MVPLRQKMSIKMDKTEPDWEQYFGDIDKNGNGEWYRMCGYDNKEDGTTQIWHEHYKYYSLQSRHTFVAGNPDQPVHVDYLIEAEKES